MIDCTKTESYFTEKRRMIGQQKDGICQLDCIDCPLSIENNGTGIECSVFETLYPEKAIAIVQKWSDEHPQNTCLSEFLKNHPNVMLNDDGTPTFCPYELSLISVDNCRNDGDCVKCWNQPIEESESK